MKKALIMVLCLAMLCFAVSCSDEERTLGEYGNSSKNETVSEEGSSTVSAAPTGELDGEVTIYRPDGEYMYIETVKADFKGDALDLIELMVENNALVEGVSADEFYIKDEVIYVNMNKAYEKYVCAGSTAEYFGLACLVNTLITNYTHVGVEKVAITVEGRELNSHGGIGESPMGIFE